MAKRVAKTVTKNCEQCGKEFTRTAVTYWRIKYCSDYCSDQNYRQRHKEQEKKRIYKWREENRERYNKQHRETMRKQRQIHKPKVRSRWHTHKFIRTYPDKAPPNFCIKCNAMQNLQLHHEIYPIKWDEIEIAIKEGQIYNVCIPCHSIETKKNNLDERMSN